MRTFSFPSTGDAPGAVAKVTFRATRSTAIPPSSLTSFHVPSAFRVFAVTFSLPMTSAASWNSFWSAAAAKRSSASPKSPRAFDAVISTLSVPSTGDAPGAVLKVTFPVFRSTVKSVVSARSCQVPSLPSFRAVTGVPSRFPVVSW